MNLFQKQPKTSGYNTIPNTIAVDDETAAVPLGTTLLSPSTTTTRGRRSSKRRRIASVAAGMMLLVMMVAGGTVWMRQDDGLSYNSSSGSLETEDGSLTTTWGPPGSCVPATGTWTAGPVSTTAWWGQATPFLTCWQQDQSYCWTRSHYPMYPQWLVASRGSLYTLRPHHQRRPRNVRTAVSRPAWSSSL